ncbi:MAG: hypothetical protein P4L31_04115 [Candidatus Babeliales bacterium]|nr:hypothetical protein [Candidatus Babeliales bacterium]
MSRKDTIGLFRQIAQERGGECLSSAYVDSQTELSWKCFSCNHIWKAKPSNIKGSRNKPGTWCPPCGIRKVAKARMRAIEDLQRLAEMYVGLVVSPENLGSNKKHLWRCCNYPYHPEFSMIPNAVQQGQWCPRCRGNAKPTSEELDELARQRANNSLAKCCSTHYENIASILEWWCGIEGHSIVSHVYRSVKYEQVLWCKLCKQEKLRPKKYNRDLLVRLAASCGGILLSEEVYQNTKQKHKWQCSDGHEFSRSLDDILCARSFCPYCFQRGGMREQYIRELFCFLFDSPFERTRKLSWLVNQQGRKMELDGYSPSFALAFEHNGQQHYEIDGYFMTHKDQLHKRRLDDEDKLRLCKENDVALIVIPFLISLKEIQSYVLVELIKIGIEPPNIETFLPGIQSVKMLEKLQNYAANLGGRLLSNKYLGSGEKHSWQCKSSEHPPFSMAPSSVFSGSWCGRCANEKSSESYKISTKQLQEIAEGNRCELLLDGLTEKKFASYDQATFRCLDCEELTIRTTQEAKNGSICFCRTKKVRIDRSELNKKLASVPVRIVGPDEIEGGKTMVELQCKNCEYQWSLKASYMMSGTVKCHKCAPSRNAPITIAKARTTGEKYGFKLRSDTLVNGQTKLHYECKKCGESLYISYRQMRGGCKCPQCTQEEAVKRLGLN